MACLFNTAFNFCLVNWHFFCLMLCYEWSSTARNWTWAFTLHSFIRGGWQGNKKGKFCRPVTVVEIYNDSKEVCLKFLYCIHNYYRHPSEQHRSGSKPTFRWSIMIFPPQPSTILTAKGSTDPVCLEECPKKHQTWEECVFVEARLVRIGKTKKLPEQKVFQTTESGSDREEQKLWSGILSSLFKKYGKTFY